MYILSFPVTFITLIQKVEKTLENDHLFHLYVNVSVHISNVSFIFISNKCPFLELQHLRCVIEYIYIKHGIYSETCYSMIFYMYQYVDIKIMFA